MKFPFRCGACHELNPVEYRSTNYYKYNCVRCQQTNVATIRKELFELLFDFGSWAFLDGYYREAMANFATSLERFFEFWMRTIRHQRDVGDDPFEETWKLMSKQSERQLGAFAALYLFETGNSPHFLGSEQLMSGFRNRVVHAGEIPSRTKTLEYASMVHDLIRRLLVELYDIAPDHVTRDLHNSIVEVVNQAQAEGHPFEDYAYDGMFGIRRFSPEMRAEADQRYQATQARGDKHPFMEGHEHLRTDLNFEETLKARKWYLDKQFHKG